MPIGAYWYADRSLEHGIPISHEKSGYQAPPTGNNGLYFRVKPDGQKSWQLRYKTPAGKWSWLGLGGYPSVSGSQAREKAAELRADMADGKNPIATKQARKSAELAAANNTFEALGLVRNATPTWGPTRSSASRPIRATSFQSARPRGRDTSCLKRQLSQ